MRSLLTHTVFAGVLCAAGLATTGCIEEKLEVELQPDGSGKLRFERTIGQQLSGFMLMDPSGPRSAAAEAISKFQGVEAWTDVEAGKTDDGRVRIRATGWFHDLAALKQENDKSSTSFSLQRAGDVLKLRLDASQAEQDGAGMGPGGQQKKSLFEHPPEQAPMIKEMTKGMLSSMLKGFRTEVQVHLPAAPSEVHGFERPAGADRQVGVVHTAESIGKIIDLMFDEADKIRPRVDSGELTVEEADELLKQRLEGGIKSKFGPYEATCSVAGLAVAPAFLEAYAAAKAAWETSEWRGEVERARSESELELPGEEEGPGGPEDGDEGDEDRKF